MVSENPIILIILTIVFSTLFLNVHIKKRLEINALSLFPFCFYFPRSIAPIILWYIVLSVIQICITKSSSKKLVYFVCQLPFPTYPNITAMQQVLKILFSIGKGEIVGFRTKWCGKTNIRILAGAWLWKMVHKISGNEVRNNPMKREENVGYLPEQNPLYTDMYVKEYLLSQRKHINWAKGNMHEWMKWLTW